MGRNYLSWSERARKLARQIRGFERLRRVEREGLIIPGLLPMAEELEDAAEEYEKRERGGQS